MYMACPQLQLHFRTQHGFDTMFWHQPLLNVTVDVNQQHCLRGMACVILSHLVKTEMGQLLG